MGRKTSATSRAPTLSPVAHEQSNSVLVLNLPVVIRSLPRGGESRSLRPVVMAVSQEAHYEDSPRGAVSLESVTELVTAARVFWHAQTEATTPRLVIKISHERTVD